MYLAVGSFDAYATETNRMHSDNNITQFDFWDTYLPQYEMVFTQAKAAGAMCSYQAENGYGHLVFACAAECFLRPGV